MGEAAEKEGRINITSLISVHLAYLT